MGAKKVKISSVKRAAHLKTKKKPLSKQQQQKLAQAKANQEKRTSNALLENARRQYSAVQNKRVKKIVPKSAESDEDNDQIVNNVAGMLEGDDLEYLEAAGDGRHRKRQRPVEQITEEYNSVGLELAYAKQNEKEKIEKKIVLNLLPIKTAEGEIISRTTEVDYVPKRKVIKKDGEKTDNVADEEVASVYEDSDDDIVHEKSATMLANENVDNKLVSTTDLLIARKQEIDRQKFRIGIICSGILEKPEDKMRNLNTLFDLVERKSKDGHLNLFTVRKIAIISLTEIFKDILPEYRVGQVNTKMTTVRKSTLERVTYENSLLQQFKKYLQKLEKLTSVVTKRGPGRNTEVIKIAEVAVTAFCDILLAHPYFNYVRNIAQLLVYILNCNYQSMRQCVNQCFRVLFKTDNKYDMTLFIVRRINHMIKMKSNNVHLECVTCLLALKIKNVNLDAEKEMELKQKKLESHRQRILNLSKKEKKRRKRLTELNKELEETRAEESKKTKHYKLTEITKMLFNIYFRILKNDPNSKLLSAILEGLAEFAHVINLDFFSDLIEVLNKILETMDLGYLEQLHCIHTIFVILSGQGEVLNIDPMRFYQHLYKILFIVDAGKNHHDFRIILKTLDEVLIKRRKNISQPRLIAFVKRLLSASMHLLHNGTLASLSTIKATFQLSAVLESLLDTDTSIGSGRYNAELEDPEYCNAQCTALYELTALARHYHPTVRKFAVHIMNGAPTSGEGALPSDVGKLTPSEIFQTYDSSSMAFHPPIALPRKCEPKIKKGTHIYSQDNFKPYYKTFMKKSQQSTVKYYDFHSAFNRKITKKVK